MKKNKNKIKKSSMDVINKLRWLQYKLKFISELNSQGNLNSEIKENIIKEWEDKYGKRKIER